MKDINYVNILVGLIFERERTAQPLAVLVKAFCKKKKGRILGFARHFVASYKVLFRVRSHGRSISKHFQQGEPSLGDRAS